MRDTIMKKQWEAYAAKREHWRQKNNFYYDYLHRLTSFLIPTGKRVHMVLDPTLPLPDGPFDYIVLSDMLGYIHDIQAFFEEAHRSLAPGGRIVITQYNALWEPILRMASALGLRAPANEQNWVSEHDIHTFLLLADFEPIRSGNKMLFPISVPFVSWFLNVILANLWPFSHLALIQYTVARVKPTPRIQPSLSIIVPARNEAGTIQKIVDELPALGAFTEIIFIEGHSKDNTLAKIEKVTNEYSGEKRVRYAVQEGKGKGDAVRKGFEMATGDILAIYDADMTVPPEDMKKFYEAIVAGHGDFINGSRLVYPVEKGAMRLLNMFGNAFFSAAFSAILRQRLKDTLCGTKVLWKKDYEAIAAHRAFFGEFDPFGDFDLLFGAAKLNLKIIDLPIRYRDRTYGETNISRFKHGWLLLQMTVFAARKLVFW